MKKNMPWIITGLFALWVVAGVMPQSKKDGFDYDAFGKFPAILNGRIQPLDSVARNSLLELQGKQTIVVDDHHTLSAIEWATQLMMKPEQVDDLKVIQVNHPEVKGMFGLPDNEKYFSFNQIRPLLDKLQDQIERIRTNDIKEAQQTPFEKQCGKLYSVLHIYVGMRMTLKPEQSGDFASELKTYQAMLPAGVKAVMDRNQGKKVNEEELDRFGALVQNYDRMGSFSQALLVPPAAAAQSPDQWVNIGSSLTESIRSQKINPVVLRYASMVSAYRDSRTEEFNRAVSDYAQWLKDKFPSAARKGAQESFFNHFEPFYKCMVIYVLAGLLACIAWLNVSKWSSLTRTAFHLTQLAFVVHTFGLVMRMALEGRPPVTNLYSSAIFIGWGAVLLGLVLHSIYKDGIGLVVAGGMGFITLIIAHHLSLDGDTMEMMRAVLDTNFWLATHVVAVTTGYASTFVAGFLGILYIMRGFFTRTLSKELGQRLSKMMYGIVCFAALFSFVGTVLGGIWADQSWGRFWGWDPKENGAVIIVIWNVVILHARWGGLVKERGIAAMTVFGNIVTSFSWFGVNMLGIGLHSYGFMDKAFYWLMLFDLSQVMFIVVALLPLSMWGSFHDGGGSPPTPTQIPRHQARQPVSASA